MPVVPRPISLYDESYFIKKFIHKPNTDDLTVIKGDENVTQTPSVVLLFRNWPIWVLLLAFDTWLLRRLCHIARVRKKNV